MELQHAMEDGAVLTHTADSGSAERVEGARLDSFDTQLQTATDYGRKIGPTLLPLRNE